MKETIKKGINMKEDEIKKSKDKKKQELDKKIDAYLKTIEGDNFRYCNRKILRNTIRKDVGNKMLKYVWNRAEKIFGKNWQSKIYKKSVGRQYGKI